MIRVVEVVNVIVAVVVVACSTGPNLHFLKIFNAFELKFAAFKVQRGTSLQHVPLRHETHKRRISNVLDLTMMKSVVKEYSGGRRQLSYSRKTWQVVVVGAMVEGVKSRNERRIIIIPSSIRRYHQEAPCVFWRSFL